MSARKFSISLLSTLALAILLPISADAGNGPGHGFGRQGEGLIHGAAHGMGFLERGLPRLAEELDLTDEQLARIDAIVDDARPTIEGYADQLRSARESFREANDDPTVFDEGAFRSHAEAQQELQIELMVVVQRTRAAVLQVLTAEQLQELDAMRDDGGRRFHRGFHRGSKRGRR